MDRINETQNTYTYTARSAENPDKIVTFTLVDHKLQVNPTGFVEKMEKVLDAEDMPSEITHQIQSQIQPSAAKFLPGLTNAIPLNDTNAKFDGERLSVFSWTRVGGLRLVPIQISIDEVDNPMAAEAFVDELNERKSSSEHVGRFFGPLDYWFGWVGLLIGLAVLFRWSTRREEG